MESERDKIKTQLSDETKDNKKSELQRQLKEVNEQIERLNTRRQYDKE